MPAVALLYLLSVSPLDATVAAVALEPPAQKAQNSPRTPAAKNEERGIDQYRHSPNVRALAHMMHMDVETAARTFEIVNFGVAVLASVIPLVRVMSRLVRKRSERIRAGIEAAQKIAQDANAQLIAAEAKLSNLDKEIAGFRAEVEQQIAQDEQRGNAGLEEAIARIVVAAEAEIAVAAAQSRRALRHLAADLAITQATKQLVLTAESDRVVIAEFVAEAGRDGIQGGGEDFLATRSGNVELRGLPESGDEKVPVPNKLNASSQPSL